MYKGPSKNPFFYLAPNVCSNQFFENLPAGYAALTPFGYYIPPVDKDNVDADLQLKMGEIAELR